MKRNVSLTDISDGKLYCENDMVRADCHGCHGCSDCCKGMGDTILLDPYDAYRLTAGLGRPFGDLLEREAALRVVDGYILPYLRMRENTDCCSFLGEDGRCRVHPHRPGVCRLFPLGRYYEDGDFHYFLQTGECRAVHSKIKVSKWIDTPNQKQYREFVNSWHFLLNKVEKQLEENQEEEFARRLNMLLLQVFYLLPYDVEADFYQQFAQRKEKFYALTS